MSDFYKTDTRDTSITIDPETGQVTYGSEKGTGYEPVKVPPPPGWMNVESVLVKDLPHHITRQCESVLERSGQCSAVFAHHVGVLKGAEVVDDATARQLERLSVNLANSSNQAEYYKNNVRPFLQRITKVKR
ncbi:MAG: hypothetical protein ACRD3N_01210 [Terracidiphilus sp.]